MQDVSNRTGEPLHHHLPVEYEPVAECAAEPDDIKVVERDHDVSIIRRPWHTVKVARHRPDDHVVDPLFLQPLDHPGQSLFTVHRSVTAETGV